jgi:hypothetical protein
MLSIQGYSTGYELMISRTMGRNIQCLPRLHSAFWQSQHLLSLASAFSLLESTLQLTIMHVLELINLNSSSVEVGLEG